SRVAAKAKTCWCATASDPCIGLRLSHFVRSAAPTASNSDHATQESKAFPTENLSDLPSKHFGSFDFPTTSERKLDWN
ncbi:MAG: hypothetical protein O3C60_15515, partial [Planctomycetota bacterium]|nr:hypothetical protein [Planctomycetota bacterium]